MKIRLVALLITVTNIAIAQNHDHHSGHGKQISNKTESKIKFTPTSDLKVRMEKILSPDCNYPVQLFFYHDLIRSSPVKNFHGSIVDFKFNHLQLLIGDICQIRFLREVLS